MEGGEEDGPSAKRQRRCEVAAGAARGGGDAPCGRASARSTRRAPRRPYGERPRVCRRVCGAAGAPRPPHRAPSPRDGARDGAAAQGGGASTAVFPRGAIKRVKVHDFMTYSGTVAIQPGPRLNLVLGPNGAPAARAGPRPCSKPGAARAKAVVRGRPGGRLLARRIARRPPRPLAQARASRRWCARCASASAGARRSVGRGESRARAGWPEHRAAVPLRAPACTAWSRRPRRPSWSLPAAAGARRQPEGLHPARLQLRMDRGRAQRRPRGQGHGRAARDPRGGARRRQPRLQHQVAAQRCGRGGARRRAGADAARRR
jgi:hypothetical protein